jgi:hypothetical protein
MKTNKTLWACPACSVKNIIHDMFGHHCGSCGWDGLLCGQCGADLGPGISGFKNPREPLCMACYPGSGLEKLHKSIEEQRQVKKFNKRQLSKYLKEQRKEMLLEMEETSEED